MNHEDATLKVQALIDNELSETDMKEVLDHLQSCYRCRDEYINLKVLERKMKGIRYPEPPQEWFESLYRSPGRRSILLLGKLILGGSTALVFGWLVRRMVVDGTLSLIMKIAGGGMVLGGIVLFLVTLGDRIHENRDDKYKGVMK